MCLKVINGYLLILANGTVNPVPALEDTISELPYYQTTQIHVIGNW